jgi:uncharacterized protein (TIGR00730 family)
MPLDILHLTVFCGSSDGLPAHRALAQELGRLMAEERITLVYGGGRRGLMGTLAGAALAGGGKVVGIIPQALKDMELAHDGLSMLHVVDDLGRRKDMMLFMADAMIALPGGLGTLDEVSEVLALRQLGLCNKPLCLVDHAGFWQPLLDQVKQMQASGFLHHGETAFPLVAESVGQALEMLRR